MEVDREAIDEGEKELEPVAEAVALAVTEAKEEDVDEAVEEELEVAVSDKGMHPGTFQEIQGQYPVVCRVEQKVPGSHTKSLRYIVLPADELEGH